MGHVAEHTSKYRALENADSQSQLAGQTPEIGHDDRDEHDQAHGFEWFEIARVTQ